MNCLLAIMRGRETGERGLQYSVGGSKDIQGMKGKLGPVRQPLLSIYYGIRDERLERN
jgi:hypothetical protein